MEHKKNIMIMDDDHEVSKLIVRFIKASGHHYHAFTDQFKMFEYYKNNYKKVDIVLMDMMMPYMDGDECLSILKK